MKEKKMNVNDAQNDGYSGTTKCLTRISKRTHTDNSKILPVLVSLDDCTTSLWTSLKREKMAHKVHEVRAHFKLIRSAVDEIQITMVYIYVVYLFFSEIINSIRARYKRPLCHAMDEPHRALIYRNVHL